MALKSSNRIYKSYDEVEVANWRDRISGLNLDEGDTIILFGCGEWGKKLHENIRKYVNISILGFCDNNIDMQGTMVMDEEVYSPLAAVELFANAVFVIAMARNVDVIKKQLLGLGVKKELIRVLATDTSGRKTRDYFNERLNDDYILDDEYPSEIYIPVIKKNNSNDKRDFRIYLEDGFIRTLEKEIDPLDTCNMDMYERNYGTYYDVNDLKLDSDSNTKVKIMITCCHKDLAGVSEDNPIYYTPIQVGRALTDIQLYDLCDNVGDNISDRNYNYCECTALYWAWKNRFSEDADYVGLRHYRRKFAITDEQLCNLKGNNVAIVHLDPIYHDNIRYSFTNHTKRNEDWELMKRAIREMFPDYIDTFEEYENQHFICAYNMTIMRKDIFDKYCEFLFGVLMHIEEYYMKKEPERKDRYLGFLAENLTSVFLMHYRNEKQIIAKLIPIIK